MNTNKENKPNPFAAVINAAKQKAQAQTHKPTSVNPANPASLLRGAGFTKKVLAKQERQTEQAQTQAVKQISPFAALLQKRQADRQQQAEPTHPAPEQPAPAKPPMILRPVIAPGLVDQGIVLDEYQQAALDALSKRQYGCLIGSAGTGKTTTTKRLIALLEDQAFTRSTEEYKDSVGVCLCAYTGRAVQQIKKAMPNEYRQFCNTIHATLGYAPTFEERIDPKTKEIKVVRVFRPTYTEFNKLTFKVCIVDEAGMVPVHLWNELIAALPSDCVIVLIGDINQIPPVQGRSVLGFAMLQWPTYALTKIHRQAADNPIIANAHRILQGKLPIADDKHVILRELPDSGQQAQRHILATIQKLHKANLFDPMRDALIVPQNIGTIGQIALNEQLVRYFNPASENPRTIITAGYQHVTFAPGDKVMLLKNNREMELTNGMIGVVTEINPNMEFKGERIGEHGAKQQLKSMVANGAESFDFNLSADDVAKIDLKEIADDQREEKESERQASHVMIVEFQNVDEPVAFSTAGDFRNITHSYAITCHKAQGGEYHTVVMVAHASNLKMLSREWLYTAFTRATDRVIMLSNPRGRQHAVNNQRIRGNSIEEKAQSFIELMDKKDTSIPLLPTSKEK